MSDKRNSEKMKRMTENAYLLLELTMGSSKNMEFHDPEKHGIRTLIKGGSKVDNAFGHSINEFESVVEFNNITHQLYGVFNVADLIALARIGGALLVEMDFEKKKDETQNAWETIKNEIKEGK